MLLLAVFQHWVSTVLCTIKITAPNLLKQFWEILSLLIIWHRFWAVILTATYVHVPPLWYRFLSNFTILKPRTSWFCVEDLWYWGLANILFTIILKLGISEHWSLHTTINAEIPSIPELYALPATTFGIDNSPMHFW